MSNFNWLETLQPITVIVTPNRTKGDSIPMEYDYYSSVTERTFRIEDGVHLVDRKRIGIVGLNDFHWVGCLYFKDSISRDGNAFKEPATQGIWILDKRTK